MTTTITDRLLNTEDAIAAGETRDIVAELEASPELTELADSLLRRLSPSPQRIASGLRELADLVENDYLPVRVGAITPLSVYWLVEDANDVHSLAATFGLAVSVTHMASVITTGVKVDLAGVTVHVGHSKRRP